MSISSSTYKTIALFVTPLLLIATIFLVIKTPKPSVPDDLPCYYDAETLQEILAQDGCTAIRFYPIILPASAEQTVMAIGITEDGSEIYDTGSDYSYYLQFDGITGSSSETNALNAGEAKDGCSNWNEITGRSQYCAVFTADQILTELLGVAGATGILIEQSMWYSSATTKHWPTLKATSVTARDGIATPTTPAFFINSTEPCPTKCGDMSHYVCECR